jgi:prepilin-type N-terminal cleavage/methylation domain-containing protein
MRHRTARRGFTLIELLAALTVIGVAAVMFVAILMASRKSATLQAERSLAAALAQGELERLRGLPPAELPPAAGAERPLPPEAASLHGASIRAASTPWQDTAGLRHVSVTIGWDSRIGSRHQFTAEALLSDARAR